MNWTRENNLNLKSSRETWKRNHNGNVDNYQVMVDFGKKTDLLKLKTNIVSNIKGNVSFYSSSRSNFFGDENNLQAIDRCPVCKGTSAESEFRVRIYNADYYQCNSCSHIYLHRIPKLEAIERFYRTNAQYSQTYTSRESAEFRLNSVDAALAAYMTGKFSSVYKSMPGKILDIGAGGGHFVEACKRLKMEADGFEFSESSVGFAKDVWGISLDNRDYTKNYYEYRDYDVVTFWGLLEHVPEPLEFLKAASASLKKNAPRMIVCRVPKWDSVSTGVQTLCNDSIVRHLDPLGHIMIFTETSLCELFRQIGYKPAAIWYYGMDMYELLMQIGHRSGTYDHLLKSGDLQQDLQVLLDSFYLSDLMVLAFIPEEY